MLVSYLGSMTTLTVTMRSGEPLVDDCPLLLGLGIELVVLRGIDDVLDTPPPPPLPTLALPDWATCELLCEVAVT